MYLYEVRELIIHTWWVLVIFNIGILLCAWISFAVYAADVLYLVCKHMHVWMCTWLRICVLEILSMKAPAFCTAHARSYIILCTYPCTVRVYTKTCIHASKYVLKIQLGSLFFFFSFCAFCENVRKKWIYGWLRKHILYVHICVLYTVGIHSFAYWYI